MHTSIQIDPTAHLTARNGEGQDGADVVQLVAHSVEGEASLYVKLTRDQLRAWVEAVDALPAR